MVIMASSKLHIWMIVVVYMILVAPLPSAQENPCKIQRKCPYNPILYHNYDNCIVCTGQHLTSFPQGLDPAGSADAAELRENSLDEIDTSDFANFSRLYYLDLSVNIIETLQDGWAQSLSRLQYLYLSENKLRSIRRTTFIGLDLLQYLHLDRNLITRLPGHAFGRLPQLQVVHLQYNLLEVLEEDAFMGLEQLRKLNLGYNRLGSLSPDSYAGLEVLNELILSGNVFTNVPVSGLAPLVGLQHIRMDRNNITTLPTDAFANLTTLIELTMAFNKITTLQKDWCNGLGMLQYINISHNEVESLSGDVFQSCPNIVILDFSHNHLKEVSPDVVKPLQNNHAVDWCYNSLTTLSRLETVNDSMVTDLRLEGNPLECDCHLTWLKDRMASRRVSRISFSPKELFLKGNYEELNRASSPLDAQCNEPADLSGLLLRNVPRNNLTCSPFTPPTTYLSSTGLPTTEHYSILSTLETSTMYPKVSPTPGVGKFDVKMGIIVFLSVLSLTLMIILVLVVLQRQACRWKEQIYFSVSDPPLPPRYQNPGRKRAPSPSCLSSEVEDATSVMLLDIKHLDGADSTVKTDVDQVSASNPEEQCRSGICENQVEPDCTCSFCNGKSTISSTGGRQWSVVVHSPPQTLPPCLYDDTCTLQSSCDLHGHFENCSQATELDRYHKALESEAKASLAKGVILEHMRQCCSFHKSIPLHEPFRRAGKEEAYRLGPNNSLSDTPSHHNLQSLVCRRSVEARDSMVMYSSEEPDFRSQDSMITRLPRQPGNAHMQQRHPSSFLPKSFTNKPTPSSDTQHEDSNVKSTRLSCPVAYWTLPGCLRDSSRDTWKDLPSLKTTGSHQRSRSAREPRGSYTLNPRYQSSQHGNKSSLLHYRIGCGDTKSYLEDQASRHLSRPPAPLPRPETTLTRIKDAVQEPSTTQKHCIEKDMTFSESDGLNDIGAENTVHVHAEENMYFEPIE